MDIYIWIWIYNDILCIYGMNIHKWPATLMSKPGDSIWFLTQKIDSSWITHGSGGDGVCTGTGCRGR